MRRVRKRVRSQSNYDASSFYIAVASWVDKLVRCMCGTYIASSLLSTVYVGYGPSYFEAGSSF